MHQIQGGLFYWNLNSDTPELSSLSHLQTTCSTLLPQRPMTLKTLGKMKTCLHTTEKRLSGNGLGCQSSLPMYVNLKGRVFPFNSSDDTFKAGYREGITAGKESALQEGFDAGFAEVGAPLGREIGILRGLAVGCLSILSSSNPIIGETDRNDNLITEIRQIVQQLGRIRLSDIEPPDLEAEAHAMEHLKKQGEEVELSERIKDMNDIEGLEDAFEALRTSPMNSEREARSGMREMMELKGKLQKTLESCSFRQDDLFERGA